MKTIRSGSSEIVLAARTQLTEMHHIIIYINTQRTCCWVLALWDAEIGRGCRDRRSRYVDNGLAVARVMPLDTATLERNGFGVCVRGPVHVCCSAGDAAVG